MCTKCNNKDCLIGERCGAISNDTNNLLIEDGTMAAFNNPTFDSTIKNSNKKTK